MKKPNILFIMSDQHNARCMSCAGEPLLQTPNMDRIAKEGVMFVNSFSVSAHCGPSRVSFMTGMYEHTHKRHNNTDEPPDTLNPITSLLKKHDYDTAIIGKGHLGVKWPRREFNYHKFDMMEDALEDEPLSCDYYKFLVDNGVADIFDLILDTKKTEIPKSSDLPLKYSEEVWVGNETIKYLRQRDKDKPFYAFVSFQRPHNPITVPKPYDTMYDPEKVSLPFNLYDSFETKSEKQQKAGRGEGHYPHRPKSEEDLKQCLALYYGLITLIDEQIGRILNELEEEGILEDTIIVYTADHGDFAGEHGFMYKNLGLYESIQKIPLLIRYPKVIPQRKKFEGIVESVDVYPTLANLIGVPPPATVQGKSMLPALSETEPWTKKAAVCEHVKRYYHISMRTQDFRITVDATRLEEDESELYDRRKDPGELVNVWNDPDYKEVRAELTEELLRYVLCPTMLCSTPPEGWQPCKYPGYYKPKHCKEIKDIDMGVPWSEIKMRKKV